MEELPGDNDDFSDDELVRELLDDETPFLLLPTAIESEPDLEIEPAINQFVSKIYSGPTIGDIKTALTATRWILDSQEPQVSQPTDSLVEKGLERRKTENKYTVKIINTGNGLPEDGYKWRKYGQKSIKNSQNPRSYYRCTNSRCSAKKQVERSSEEPGMHTVTYEGLHLHYAYSHFQLSQPQASVLAKRPKTVAFMPDPTAEPTLMAGRHRQPQPAPPNCLNSDGAALFQTIDAATGGSHEGLLDDIVPLLVRNPLDDDAFSTCSPVSSSLSSSCSSSSSLDFLVPSFSF